MGKPDEDTDSAHASRSAASLLPTACGGSDKQMERKARPVSETVAGPLPLLGEARSKGPP